MDQNGRNTRYNVIRPTQKHRMKDIPLFYASWSFVISPNAYLVKSIPLSGKGTERVTNALATLCVTPNNGIPWVRLTWSKKISEIRWWRYGLGILSVPTFWHALVPPTILAPLSVLLSSLSHRWKGQKGDEEMLLSLITTIHFNRLLRHWHTC